MKFSYQCKNGNRGKLLSEPEGGSALRARTTQSSGQCQSLFSLLHYQVLLPNDNSPIKICPWHKTTEILPRAKAVQFWGMIYLVPTPGTGERAWTSLCPPWKSKNSDIYHCAHIDKITCWEKQNLAAELVQSRNPWAKESSLQLFALCRRKKKLFAGRAGTAATGVSGTETLFRHKRQAWRWFISQGKPGHMWSIPGNLTMRGIPFPVGTAFPRSSSALLKGETPLKKPIPYSCYRFVPKWPVPAHCPSWLFASTAPAAAWEFWLTAWDLGAQRDEGDLQKT